MEREISVSPYQNLRLALLCALAAHVLLLALIPGVSNLTDDMTRAISFNLVEQEHKPQTQGLASSSDSAEDKLLPRAETKPNENRNLDHGHIAPFISAKNLSDWSRREAEQFLNTRPTELSRLEQSFKAPAASFEEVVSSYTNSFGEQHFVTSINGKPVCYMYGPPLRQDDWSAEIVMFYKCGKSDSMQLRLE